MRKSFRRFLSMIEVEREACSVFNALLISERDGELRWLADGGLGGSSKSEPDWGLYASSARTNRAPTTKRVTNKMLRALRAERRSFIDVART
jgi:hypothetical protein